ncbi:MAG: sigma-70 family RNA polymerase sigma factor [Sarcina sp.]
MEDIIFKKAQKGDSDSFYKLIEPIKDKLYKIAYTYMKNENDAMDAVSDSIVKAIKNIEKCKGYKSFNSWITTILVNTCKNNLKSLNKVDILEMHEFENKIIYEDKHLEHDDLYNALDNLGDRERDLIVKRYINDMTIKEISKSNSIAEGTVKSGISRTLRKLKVILGGV